MASARAAPIVRLLLSASSFRKRAAWSRTWTARAKFSTSLHSASPSRGVNSPAATACTIAAAALTASAVVSRRGMANGIGRSFGGG